MEVLIIECPKCEVDTVVKVESVEFTCTCGQKFEIRLDKNIETAID